MLFFFCCTYKLFPSLLFCSMTGLHLFAMHLLRPLSRTSYDSLIADSLEQASFFKSCQISRSHPTAAGEDGFFFYGNEEKYVAVLELTGSPCFSRKKIVRVVHFEGCYFLQLVVSCCKFESFSLQTNICIPSYLSAKKTMLAMKVNFLLKLFL